MGDHSKIEEIKHSKREIETRIYELQGLSHMMEILLTEVDLDQLKRERIDPGILFSAQKRLYSDLHTAFYDFAKLTGIE